MAKLCFSCWKTALSFIISLDKHVSSDSGHWGTQSMPPPRYCFGLLFSDLIDRLLFKTHQKFKMALGERSESVRNLVTYVYVKVN